MYVMVHCSIDVLVAMIANIERIQLGMVSGAKLPPQALYMSYGRWVSQHSHVKCQF